MPVLIYSVITSSKSEGLFSVCLCEFDVSLKCFNMNKFFTVLLLFYSCGIYPSSKNNSFNL